MLAGTYIDSVRVGIVQFEGETPNYLGKVGDSVTIEQAYEMARNCTLNHLAKIKAALGDLDLVERIAKGK